MPIYTYSCPKGHTFDILWLSFKEAAEHSEYTVCKQHSIEADRMPEVPLEAHFYGDSGGYTKPSPTKRYSTKLVSAKEGNDNAVG